MQQKLGLTVDQRNQQQEKVQVSSSSEADKQIEITRQLQIFQPIIRISQQLKDIKYQISEDSYATHGQLLSHTKIRAQDRQKLKSWLLSQTQNIYQRETYALASKYLDLFFSKKCRIQKNTFQILGIACLILAAKVNERRIPSISFQVFDRTQIFHYEKLLLQILNFKVNPVTYVTLTQLLLTLWDKFKPENQLFRQIKYYKQGVQSIRRVRIIMQTLDCMDLVPKTLDIQLSSLVFTVFFLENRRFCRQIFNRQLKYRIHNDEPNLFNHLYQKQMERFCSHISSNNEVFSNIGINYKLLSYSMRFSRINPKVRVNPRYKNFRFETTRQTYNPQITVMAQRYLSQTN